MCPEYLYDEYDDNYDDMPDLVEDNNNDYNDKSDMDEDNNCDDDMQIWKCKI